MERPFTVCQTPVRVEYRPVISALRVGEHGDGDDEPLHGLHEPEPFGVEAGFEVGHARRFAQALVIQRQVVPTRQKAQGRRCIGRATAHAAGHQGGMRMAKFRDSGATEAQLRSCRGVGVRADLEPGPHAL